MSSATSGRKPRLIACPRLSTLSLIPAFIVMKAADEFKDKTTAPNQLWQTDFTYLKVTGRGWFNLSTVLDDFSRYIVAWKLCITMKAEDVTDTLELALQASGLDRINVAHRPRLLSDNGPRYVSAELRGSTTAYPRGALSSDDTGKIERWHLTLKNRILLENYYLPGEIEARIEAFVAHYNHLRYHESIDNLTLIDVYFGAVKPSCWKEKGSNVKPSNTDACFTKLMQPKIKPDAPDSPLGQDASCLKISDDGQSSCDPVAGQRKRMNAWRRQPTIIGRHGRTRRRGPPSIRVLFPPS